MENSIDKITEMKVDSPVRTFDDGVWAASVIANIVEEHNNKVYNRRLFIGLLLMGISGKVVHKICSSKNKYEED